MNESPRNFASHLLDDLQAQRLFREKQKRPQPALDWVEQMVRRAVHFVMPEGGRLFDDRLRAIEKDARLCYPVVALEYSMRAPDKPELFFGEPTTPCPNRVAIGVDLRQEKTRPAWMSAWEILLRGNGVNLDDCIISISAAQADDMWLIVPAALAADTSCLYDSAFIAEKVRNPNAAQKILMDELGGAPALENAYRTYVVPLVPEYVGALIMKAGSQDRALAQIKNDLVDEEMAVLEFVEAMSCSNVRAEVVRAAPAALNKQRARKHKAPLFEYRSLVIDLPQTERGKNDGLRSGRAAPRVHLRRGHVRRLPEKKIWVNAAVVGSRDRGIVHKDYALTVEEK